MIFSTLFKSNKNWHTQAHALYLALVGQARQPDFYAVFGVPDTVDGRFDMVTLHMFMLQRRLKHAAAPASEVGEALMTVMASDMDRSLREMGVGDYSVGKRLKQMMSAFYGRAAAYEAGLDGDDATLAAAIARNVFRDADADVTWCRALAGYMRRQADWLDRQPTAGLLAGQVEFAPVDASEQAEERR